MMETEIQEARKLAEEAADLIQIIHDRYWDKVKHMSGKAQDEFLEHLSNLV